MSGIPPLRPDTGLCFYEDPEIWFKQHKAPAIRICRNCPIIIACAREALDRDATHGVWAGVSLPGQRSLKPLLAAREQLRAIANSRPSDAAQARSLQLREAVHFAATQRRHPSMQEAS